MQVGCRDPDGHHHNVIHAVRFRLLIVTVRYKYQEAVTGGYAGGDGDAGAVDRVAGSIIDQVAGAVAAIETGQQYIGGGIPLVVFRQVNKVIPGGSGGATASVLHVPAKCYPFAPGGFCGCGLRGHNQIGGGELCGDRAHVVGFIGLRLLLIMIRDKMEPCRTGKAGGQSQGAGGVVIVAGRQWRKAARPVTAQQGRAGWIKYRTAGKINAIRPRGDRRAFTGVLHPPGESHLLTPAHRCRGGGGRDLQIGITNCNRLGLPVIAFIQLRLPMGGIGVDNQILRTGHSLRQADVAYQSITGSGCQRCLRLHPN